MIGLTSSQKSNYFRALLSIFLIIMLLSSGLVVSNAAADDETITLRCAIKPLMTTNPLNADQDDWKVLNMIYEGATKNHPTTGERLPYIAVGSASKVNNTFSTSWSDCVVGNFSYCPESTWEDPEKPEIIIFYDFEDVYWHDGEQMNIRDIMFTFHVNADEQFSGLGHPLVDKGGRPGSNYTDTHWLFIQKLWESEDSSRAALKFTLQAPYFSVFDYYLSAPILPYHIWGNMVGNQLINNTKIWSDNNFDKGDEFSWKAYFAVKFDNAWPIGSGPFRWDGSGYDSITLVPWEKHFYKPGFKYYSNQKRIMEQPEIDRLSLKFYYSEERAVMDLDNNRIDYIAWDLPQSALAGFVNNPDVSLTSIDANSMIYIGYNMKRKSFGYDYSTFNQTAEYEDYGKPLRLALAHCIDDSTISIMSNMYVEDTDSISTLGNWVNESAPSFLFDPSEAITILREANYILENPDEPPGEGNWWKNPDGSAIGSSLEGKVQVLVTGSEYDTLKFNIGTLLVNQMIQIGINAELVSLSPEDIALLLNQREYDIFLGDEDMTGIFGNGLENYAYTRFHSYNSYDGPNVIGYRNTSADPTIIQSMAATESGNRRKLVGDFMASLAFDQPMSVVHSRVNVEIYRLDNFYGLVDDGSGTLLNARSMNGVRMQEKNSLKARFIGLPLTLTSNLTITFKVRVVDQRGNVMAGAYINLETSNGELLNNTGTTDNYGMFVTNFTAPYVPLKETHNNWEQVTIMVKSAKLTDYRDAPEVSFTLTVVPDQLRQLSVKASVSQDVFEDTDNLGNPGFTYLEIQVVDSLNIPVGGAAIKLEAFGGDLTLSSNEIKADQAGKATVRVTASDIDNATECTIQINVSKARFINATQNISFMVLPNLGEPEQAKESTFGWIAIPIAVSIVLISVTGIVIYDRRRKKQK